MFGLSLTFQGRMLAMGLVLTMVGNSALAQGRGAARGPRPRVSPHETISTKIGNNRITVTYGRPFSKTPNGTEIRKIWGALVPYGQVWRAGADEATTLITQQPLVFGTTEVPAGAYTLFMLPAEDGSAKLIISKQIGHWGTEYDEKNDFARVDMTKSDVAEQVDQFAISITPDGTGGGSLKFTWEKAEYAAAFKIKS